MLSLFLELFGLLFGVYFDDRYDFIVFSHHGLGAALDPKLLEKCLLHGRQDVCGEFRVFAMRAHSCLLMDMGVMVKVGFRIVVMMMLEVIFDCYNGRLVVVMRLVS
jgi:hypothetical protein